MRKTFPPVLFLALLWSAAVTGAPPLLFRPAALPGGRAAAPATAGEQFTVPPACAREGTFAMWLRPDGWGGGDPAWHFMVRGRGESGAAAVMLYRFPDGRFRLLWNLDAKTRRTDEIVAPAEFLPGRWIHLAFGWKEESGTTRLTLWIDGRVAGKRKVNFAFGSAFPRRWSVGDTPGWTPRSRFGSTLGRCELHDVELSDAAVAGLAGQRFVNGQMSVTNREFPPGSVNTVVGESAEAAAHLRADFIGESGKVTTRKLAVRQADGKFTATVAVPDHAVETRLTLCRADGTSPVWKLTGIRYAPWLPPLIPDYWQASWIWSPGRPVPETHRYFIREFEADPATLSLAAFQWACDNQADIYLNGTHIGQVRSWAVPMVNDRLLPLLRRGRNVLAADAYHISGGAGFFGELTLLKKDGSAVKIGTDATWRASETLVKNWLDPNFDCSAWPAAKVLMRPPQPPYGMTPYRNFVPTPELRMLTPPAALTAQAGQSLELTARFTAPPRLPASPVEWVLSLPAGDVFRTPARLKLDGSGLNVSGRLDLPAAAAGRFTLKLESRGLKFPAEVGTLSVTPGPALPELTARVERLHGLPRLTLNGRPTPMMPYETAINFRDDCAANRFITPFDRMGLHLVETGVSFGRIWRPDGSPDTAKLDRHVISCLFYAPEARLILFFNTDAPDWLVRKYPSDRFVGDKGVIDRLSYASENYRSETAKFLTAVVEHLKKQPYYGRIAGFGFSGGEDGQFMQWTGRNMNFVGDYSAPMLRYFQNFLKAKYGDIAALNRAWGTQLPDFAAVAVPTVERRRGNADKLFLDPRADADVIDFNFAFGRTAADYLLLCAETVKKASDDRKITGAYYGKFFSIAGINQWGELSVERTLRSPALDYLVAVEYHQRGAGLPHSQSAAPESYALHNKIFVDEADLRTFLSGSKNWAYAGTGFATVAMIRKMFAFSQTRGHGIHWYDIHGGAFDNTAIQEAIASCHRVAAATLKARKRPAEIAFIVDEPSLAYSTFAARSFYGRTLRSMQGGAWGRMGAPFDVYFSGDLDPAQLADCKLLVFVNCFAPSPELRRLADRCKTGGRTLLFLGGQGMYAAGTLGAANVSAFTGIRVRDGGKRDLALKLTPADLPELNLAAAGYSSAGTVVPTFLPDDPEARVFGALPDGSGALAIRKFRDWTAVYSAVPVLPPELYRALAQRAGAHIFSTDRNVMIYVGDGLLGVHCAAGGRKTISWPETAQFVDAVTGQVYARSARSVTLDMKDGETKLILIEQPLTQGGKIHASDRYVSR